MNICIFCSAADVDPKYMNAADELGRLIAKSDHTLVWGGSDRGMMRTIAAAAQKAGGRIIGITMEQLKSTARASADQMIVTADLAERKAVMLDKSDAFIILPGGTGTLDEYAEAFELKRHGVHDKPLIILNTDDFYAGLRLQYKRMTDEGFLHRLRMPLDQLVAFAETPSEAIELVNAPRPDDQVIGATTITSAEAV